MRISRLLAALLLVAPVSAFGMTPQTDAARQAAAAPAKPVPPKPAPPATASNQGQGEGPDQPDPAEDAGLTLAAAQVVIGQNSGPAILAEKQVMKDTSIIDALVSRVRNDARTIQILQADLKAKKP